MRKRYHILTFKLGLDQQLNSLLQEFNQYRNKVIQINQKPVFVQNMNGIPSTTQGNTFTESQDNKRMNSNIDQDLYQKI